MALPLSEPPAIIEFGRYRIFPRRRQLFIEGRPIALGDRAFEVLLALIETPGAVVGKDELLSRVWQDRIVEENRLQGEISALRKVFGADRELIRTVAGRGYQFTGEIRTRPADASEQGAVGVAPAALSSTAPVSLGCSPCQQAVYRRVALRQYERRPGARVFRRRHGRGDHHGALAHPMAVCHRP